MLLFNVTVNAKVVDEAKETFVNDSNIREAEKLFVERQKDFSSEVTEPSLPLSTLSICPTPEAETAFVSQQTTGSSIPTVADESYESVLSVSLKCTDHKPEVDRLCSDRKLVVIRTADIPRSRSADIFRPDNVAATSGPTLARAQSETRDVVHAWNALEKTEQASALENLSLLVCPNVMMIFYYSP